MEPRGKSQAKPRHGRVKNYEKMSEFNEARQMSVLCPSAIPRIGAFSLGSAAVVDLRRTSKP